ncbi:MAG: ornithine cyclodeaminase family protein [Gemmatimonadota bacterium]
MRCEDPLFLTRRDVAELLTLDECIAAVHHAFRLHGQGLAARPGILGLHVDGGGFHIKAGVLPSARSPHPYFAAKINANFPGNPRIGLPLIQGVIALCDAENGAPLALMDSIEITVLRTGAATAVAAKHLAREDARVAAIVGCGNQGRIQLRSIASVRQITQAFAFDENADRAAAFAPEMSAALGIAVHAVPDPALATTQSDIVVTCTPSRRAFLGREHVRPGTFVAAVGADSEDKQELEPALMAASIVVVDVLEQCATIGDLHHAIEAGLATRASVHAELGEVVAGKKPGRRAPDEVIVFDSTGMALQDVAAAVAVYEKACAAGAGTRLHLNGRARTPWWLAPGIR